MSQHDWPHFWLILFLLDTNLRYSCCIGLISVPGRALCMVALLQLYGWPMDISTAPQTNAARPFPTQSIIKQEEERISEKWGLIIRLPPLQWTTTLLPCSSIPMIHRANSFSCWISWGSHLSLMGKCLEIMLNGGAVNVSKYLPANPMVCSSCGLTSVTTTSTLYWKDQRRRMSRVRTKGMGCISLSLLWGHFASLFSISSCFFQGTL